MLGLACAGAVLADAAATAKGIEAYLAELEADIVELSAAREMLVRNTGMADRPIEKLMKRRTEISTILRTNSRGLVVNEMHAERSAGKKFRDLSNQKWFKETSDLRRYYGSTISSGGRYSMFWCIPIRVALQSGTYRSGGAIVARIDMRGAFESAAKRAKDPFVVLDGRQRVYSSSWKNAYEVASRHPLTVKGLDNLVVGSRADEEPKQEPAAEAGPPAGGPEAAATAQADSSLRVHAVAPAETVTKRQGKLPIGLIILFVVVGIFLALAAALFQRMNKKRHDALMHTIDRESSPFEYGETVVMDRTKLMQMAGPGEAAPQEEGVRRQYIPASPQAGPQRPRDPFKETRIMSLDEMKAEVEADINQKLNSVLVERTKQIRKEVYGEVRLAFLQNMKGYSVAIGQQSEKLSRFIQAGGARGPRETQALQHILAELQKIRNSIEGR